MSGEIEILSGWDTAHPFAVMHWNRQRDSGWCVDSFRNQRDAVRYALVYTREHCCEIHNAEIILLSEGRK